MPPAEHAASTLIGQWGAAGSIIVFMGLAMIGVFRYLSAQIDRILATTAKEREEITAREKAERAEMRVTHAADRMELQRTNQQNHDASISAIKDVTAATRAVELVLRDLTGEIGSIKEWAKTRQNGG